MALPLRQIFRQGPVLAALGDAAFSAVAARFRPAAEAPAVGATAEATISPPPRDLVEEFIRRSGGDPASWRSVVPPHLFPHWGFPLTAKVLRGLPYPLWRVLNAGCAITVNAPLPADRSLVVTARLAGLDVSERRAVVKTRLETGPADRLDALVAELFAYVPLGRSSGGARSEPVVAPLGARELARWRLGADAGAEFALLTGDVNPIHWLPPYARAFGFRNVILHGFGTMARTVESLVRGRFAGDSTRFRALDVRFARPLVLPAEVGLYAEGERVFVADAPGAPAYLTGTVAP
jgi:hypothetical protein